MLESYLLYIFCPAAIFFSEMLRVNCERNAEMIGLMLPKKEGGSSEQQ